MPEFAFYFCCLRFLWSWVVFNHSKKRCISISCCFFLVTRWL